MTDIIDEAARRHEYRCGMSSSEIGELLFGQQQAFNRLFVHGEGSQKTSAEHAIDALNEIQGVK
jgi:hypothetical protein